MKSWEWTRTNNFYVIECNDRFIVYKVYNDTGYMIIIIIFISQK